MRPIKLQLARRARSERAVPGWVRTVLVSAALLALLLVPRLAELNALVTPDEPLWIARSANFYQALDSGHFADTYQFVHPGVPVMWLGALGYVIHIPSMPELMGGQFNERGRDFETLLESNGYPVLDVLIELRQVVTIASALVVIAIFLCLTRIVEFWMAAAAVAFLSLDPMHIGFTRLLHLDGISANLGLLAVVAFCWYITSKSWTALAMAGAVTAIACLTRSANAVLAPFFLIVTAADIGLFWRRSGTFPKELLRRYVIALVIAGAITLVVFVVLWPAMWVNPIGTLREMASGGRELAERGADRRPLFFRGQITGNPAPTYYPVVLFHRLGGFTAFGLVLAAIAAVRPRDFGARMPRLLCAHLVVYAALYVAVLSLSSKKFDRYVLPSVVALDIVAGLAWVVGVIWIAHRLPALNARTARVAASALMLVVLLAQTDYALRFRPFYIDAASPLNGGVQGASEAFSYNWGEGGKQVAEALLSIPGIESARVIAGPWPVTIDYYLPFQVIRPNDDVDLRAAAVWIQTDYIVVAFPEIQRRTYSLEMLAWFAAQTPVRIVTTIDGEYARIYDIRGVPPPAPFYQTAPKVSWSGIGTVVAGRFPVARSSGIDNIRSTLLVDADPASGAVRVHAQFVAPDGRVAAEVDRTVSYAPAESGRSEIAFTFNLPGQLTPGDYVVRYQLLDADTGVPIPAVNELTGELLSGMVPLGTIEIRPAAAPETE